MLDTFNDVINASTFDISDDASDLFLFVLCSCIIAHFEPRLLRPFPKSGFEETIFLGTDDLNRVNWNLATSQDNTYLTVAATIADDVHGLDTVAVTDWKSLRASAFTGDTTAPVLEQKTLKLNAG